METSKKIKDLNDFVRSKGFSEEEVTRWYNLFIDSKKFAQPAAPSKVIRTPLPIVYKSDCKMECFSYLDLNRKQEVWGCQLPCNILIKKTVGGGEDITEYTSRSTLSVAPTYERVKKFAEKIVFAGKYGNLPPQEQLEISQEAEYAFNATMKILTDNKIKADKYYGAIWCTDTEKNLALRYNLVYRCFTHGNYVCGSERIALSF